MEREILLTGIGGQGVQLAANVLAQAALTEGRDVQLFGSYGGMMRGGNTDAVVVVSDDVIESPPTVGWAWSAILMHPDYADPVLSCLRPGGLVLRNAVLWDGALERADLDVVDLAATDLATQAGHVMAASMVMLGALSSLTGVVRLVNLRAGVRTCVPPYRQQHLDLNDRALRAGADAVGPRPAQEAWPGAPTLSGVGS